jgi:hypothetical protein
MKSLVAAANAIRRTFRQIVPRKPVEPHFSTAGMSPAHLDGSTNLSNDQRVQWNDIEQYSRAALRGLDFAQEAVHQVLMRHTAAEAPNECNNASVTFWSPNPLGQSKWTITHASWTPDGTIQKFEGTEDFHDPSPGKLPAGIFTADSHASYRIERHQTAQGPVCEVHVRSEGYPAHPSHRPFAGQVHFQINENTGAITPLDVDHWTRIKTENGALGDFFA